MLKYLNEVWKSQKVPILFIGMILILLSFFFYSQSQSKQKVITFGITALEVVTQVEQNIKKISEVKDDTNLDIPQYYNKINTQLGSLKSYLNVQKNLTSTYSQLEISNFGFLPSKFNLYIKSIDSTTDKLIQEYKFLEEINPLEESYSKIVAFVDNPDLLITYDNINSSLDEGKKLVDKMEIYGANSIDLTKQGQILDYTKPQRDYINQLKTKLEQDTTYDSNSLRNLVKDTYQISLPKKPTKQILEAKTLLNSDYQESRKALLNEIDYLVSSKES
jgi:hypothetical protein